MTETTELFPMAELKPKTRLPLNLYVLVANWQGDYWSTRGEYPTEDKARNAAEQLNAGWIERKIFHLKETI